MKNRFVLNNEMLDIFVVVDGKQATVMDHVADALQSKFSEHPDILANLFWLRPTKMPMAEKIGSWTANDSSSRPKEGIRNLKLASGPNGTECTFEVRFVGEPPRNALVTFPNIERLKSVGTIFVDISGVVPLEPSEYYPQ